MSKVSRKWKVRPRRWMGLKQKVKLRRVTSIFQILTDGRRVFFRYFVKIGLYWAWNTGNYSSEASKNKE
ncbi:hypothetical protein BSK48_06500 [Paenibacillus odorifer]|nr:hypothetical protein BSK48_06500 [Paenibacillus odorifer]